MPDNQSQPEVPTFSMVQGGPFYALRKALGIVPEKQSSIGKRIVILVAAIWLPIVIAAALERRFFPGENPDPLVRHFGVHARLLIAIPLLIFAEVVMDRVFPTLVRQFTLSGLVAGRIRQEFVMVLDRAAALRDSIWGQLLVVAAIAGSIVMSAVSPFASDELSWAASGQAPVVSVGFAGWWFLYVGRPVFAGLLALWMWRLFVAWRLARGISNLDLQLVPTHPDRAGGLAFVQQASVANAPIVLAISVVLAGRWAHEVLYHGTHVDSLKVTVAAYAILVLVLFLGPLLLFSRNLRRFRRRALMEYSALVGGQGSLIYRKWIQKEDVGDPPIFDSPELGCLTDTNAVYEAVANMRSVPIGKEALIPLVLAVAVPMLPVFLIEVPVKTLLLKIATSLL